MRRNHCDSSFFSTSAPERQPRPSITCSLASTVPSTGSQLTQLSLRSTRPGGQEVQEQLLLVAVIGRIAGGELARPVEREAHALQLGAHRGDVVPGPFGRVDAALARRVLGRQAERVPAHRVQHVEAAGPLVARHHVAQRVVADVPHVDLAAGIGEHLQHVVFRLAGGGHVRHAEAAALGPGALPSRLGRVEIVARLGRVEVVARLGRVGVERSSAGAAAVRASVIRGQPCSFWLGEWVRGVVRIAAKQASNQADTEFHRVHTEFHGEGKWRCAQGAAAEAPVPSAKRQKICSVKLCVHSVKLCVRLIACFPRQRRTSGLTRRNPVHPD